MERYLVRKTHQALRRVTQDFESRWHFNSTVAVVMDLYNEIHANLSNPGVRPEITKHILEMLTLMLAPMTPHLAEELWEMLGHTDGLWTASWPATNEELAREDEVEIPVQVNGRVRGRVKAAAGANEEEVVKLALADPGVAHHANGKRIVKKIFVPDKLLNLVVA
jgi:leucyl-tRNA synthetase